MRYGERVRPKGGAAWLAIAMGTGIIGTGWPGAVAAQVQAPDDTAPPLPPTRDVPPSEVTVTGKRIPGSAIGAVAPVAVLDAQALEAMGATSLSDLLKKM